MATDNLTLKFQEELEKRSKASSANQPSSLQTLPASGTGSLWNSLGREEFDTGVSSSFLKDSLLAFPRMAGAG